MLECRWIQYEAIGALARRGSAKNPVHVPAFDNDFVALVDQADFDRELALFHARPVLGAFDLELRLQRVVLEHRLPE